MTSSCRFASPPWTLPSKDFTAAASFPMAPTPSILVCIDCICSCIRSLDAFLFAAVSTSVLSLSITASCFLLVSSTTLARSLIVSSRLSVLIPAACSTTAHSLSQMCRIVAGAVWLTANAPSGPSAQQGPSRHRSWDSLDRSTESSQPLVRRETHCLRVGHSSVAQGSTASTAMRAARRASIDESPS